VSVYLDNLVAQINTPVLEQLSLTLLFELVFTLVNLTKFVHRTEGSECPVARVIFNQDSASIDAGIGKVTGSLHVNVPLWYGLDVRLSFSLKHLSSNSD
jgi:hypothetical protein